MDPMGMQNRCKTSSFFTWHFSPGCPRSASYSTGWPKLLLSLSLAGGPWLCRPVASHGHCWNKRCQNNQRYSRTAERCQRWHETTTLPPWPPRDSVLSTGIKWVLKLIMMQIGLSRNRDVCHDFCPCNSMYTHIRHHQTNQRRQVNHPIPCKIIVTTMTHGTTPEDLEFCSEHLEATLRPWGSGTCLMDSKRSTLSA